MRDRYKLSFPLAPRGFAAHSRILARLVSLAQRGKIAHRLHIIKTLLLQFKMK